VAESLNARRERIAEMIFAAMIGSSEWCRDNTEAVLAHEARKVADVFLAHAPEQPQPPADASPSLLEAATHAVNVWRTLASPSSMQAAFDALRDAIEREEARRG
jgi:hypothetical protein